MCWPTGGDIINLRNQQSFPQSLFGIKSVPKPKIKVSVIIPAYNEELRLPHTLRKTAEFLASQPYNSEIIVVTDGSTDATEDVVQAAAERWGGIKLLSFAKNRGKGFAVKYGMLNAVGDYRLFMDADYAVPIEFLAAFLSQIEQGGDVIIGSRSHKDTQIEAPQRFPRQQLAITFGYLQRAILRMPFLDTQCGFKLFTAEAAKLLFPHIIFECAYFDAELLYVANKMKLSVKEIGVTWRHDQETRLPIGIGRSLDLFQKLVCIPSIHADIQPVARSAEHVLEAVR